MARPLRRLVGLLLIVVAALGLAAGCGGGGGQDRTAGLTATQLLTQSSAAARAATSFRISFAVTGRIALSQPGVVPGGALLNGPIDITGEGPVAPPDKASVDTRVKVSGLPVQVNVTRVGDAVYISALGQDFHVVLPPRQVALLNFGALYPALVRWAVAPEIAGREDINGTQTVKVTARLDPQRALADVAPLLGGRPPSAATARAAVRRGTLETWIGTQDLRPRRVHVVLTADGSRVAPGVGDVDLDLTADLSNYNEPVQITAPANAQTLDLNQLGGLFGG